MEIMELNDPSNASQQNSDATLPSIVRKDKQKRRVLVQRNKQVPVKASIPVPVPGQEYDYRRTPDPAKPGTRKHYHGQIRPQIPPDTNDLESLKLEFNTPAPTMVRHKTMERLDIARCPTPRDENRKERKSYPDQPLESARSAWDAGNTTCRANVIDGGEDLADILDDSDIITPRYTAKRPTINVRHRKLKASQSLRPYDAQNMKYDVILSDIERESGALTPNHGGPLDLTENVIHYYFQKRVDKDKRIVRWLVDCEEKSCNQLPSHLPDISPTRRTISFDET